MVLDTGATFTIVSWGIAELLGYASENTSQIKIITASGTETVKTLHVSKLRALGKEMRNLKIVCHDLPAESGVDGLLGLDFLKNFNLFIAFKKGFIELA
jgi:predicted aspartyl protease